MRTRFLLTTAAIVGLASCQLDPAPGDDAGDSSAEDATDDGADGESTAGSGPATDDADDSDEGGESSTDDPPDDAEALEVLEVLATASAMNGDSLSIPDYEVVADGVLVVRGGAAGGLVQSVTFDGEPMLPVMSHEEPDYWFAISADMYWLPVTAGQSGDIAWEYSTGEWSTRRRGMIAATIRGVDHVHAMAMATDGLGTNEGRTGPSVAQLELTTTEPAVIVTAFTSNGPGPSDLTGSGHTLDAFPTVPIEDFHSTRVYGGHVVVDPGTFTLGYENNETNGWFDYIVFAVAFSRDG